MQTDHRYLNAELFEIDLDELLTAISGTQVVVSTCSTSPAAEALFPGEQQKYWHLTRLFELEGTQLLSREEGGDEGLRLFTVSPPKATTYFPYGINRDEMAIYVRPTRKLNLAEPTSSGFPLARSILAKAIRDKVAPPLNSTGWTVYDESSDLGKKLSGVKRNPLLEPLRIHQGFSFQFRTFHGKLLAQILPKSVISYTKTIRQ